MLAALLAFFPFTLSSLLGSFLPAQPVPQIPDFHPPLQAIYLTSQTVESPAGQTLISEFRQAGGNMIIFDIQDSGGRLAYTSELPLSHEIGNRSNRIPNLKATVDRLHGQGYYVTARFVLLKNTVLARSRPKWTLKRRGTGSPFVSRDGPIWLDPSHPEARAYLFAVAHEIADAGVDEIQFDYVRFPEGGKGGYIGYSFESEATMTRDQAITDFVAGIANELHARGVNVSLDIFGIVVWDNISWKIIGQNIGELSKHVDALYPMPYPSHFGRGWGGHRNPGDEPYFFVQETTKKFLEQTAGGRAAIRPWLQGFAMNVTNFGPAYITEQIRALSDIGIHEWAVWNARNDYRVTLKAMR